MRAANVRVLPVRSSANPRQTLCKRLAGICLPKSGVPILLSQILKILTFLGEIFKNLNCVVGP
jgi:hypothetical protein